MRMFYSVDGVFGGEDDAEFCQATADRIAEEIQSEPWDGLSAGFIGFHDEALDKTVQFAREGEDKYLVDIPNAEKQQSLRGKVHTVQFYALVGNAEQMMSRIEELVPLNIQAWEDYSI